MPDKEGEDTAALKAQIAELKRRLRNNLAAVRHIARRTGENSESVEEYQAHLDGRLAAFARAQAALIRGWRSGIDFKTLIAEELLVYAVREDGALALSGPNVRLLGRAAETMRLAIHELATNAVKYGGLAEAGRGLSVHWWIEDERLELEWRESVAEPLTNLAPTQGFGLELLQQGLAYELKAETRLEFAETGFSARISLPPASGARHFFRIDAESVAEGAGEQPAHQ
ncbi:hypothetical protein CLG96_04525 [Sphingomonas oleivorans]|uniref:histidine kinase n=1 Tax=Sphingomonas oleivorans TaxID=1735121 RepID=A0A2T5G2J7_9SPHN|nr:HWE histidine kinase domain-containing protein [Sphingomonas oleivorans]PTQ13367.1 hypothetical protein CLG96_04525 [Sphingomonas oleivorans]